MLASISDALVKYGGGTCPPRLLSQRQHTGTGLQSGWSQRLAPIGVEAAAAAQGCALPHLNIYPLFMLAS